MLTRKKIYADGLYVTLDRQRKLADKVCREIEYFDFPNDALRVIHEVVSNGIKEIEIAAESIANLWDVSWLLEHYIEEYHAVDEPEQINWIHPGIVAQDEDLLVNLRDTAENIPMSESYTMEVVDYWVTTDLYNEKLKVYNGDDAEHERRNSMFGARYLSSSGGIRT